MRILHTSDWHLGRAFHGASLLEHQAIVLEHLVEVTHREKVDVVVVAGDIYDRALPPTDAVALADSILTRLAFSPASVILTSGNHDSAQRLGFGSKMSEAAGLFIRTHPDTVAEPVIVRDDHGPVAFYPIPYLDPNAVAEPWNLQRRSHAAALGEAMTRVRADLAGQPTGTRSVAMAHAFVADVGPGARAPQASDSERDISVGGVELVPASVFDGIGYVALGHLHGRHRITERAYYSGSPLAYSFSEARHTKGSWLVDLDAEGTVSTTFIEAPVPRGLARLEGTLEGLLADRDLAAHEADWVEVTLTDPTRPQNAMERLRRRFPHAVSLRFSELHRPDVAATRVVGLSDAEIVASFVGSVRGTEPSPAEAELFARAIDACCGAEATT